MQLSIVMAFVAGVNAASKFQNTTTSTDVAETITEYYPDCSTLPVDPTVSDSFTSTTIDVITETLPCHKCEDMTKGVYTTYTTVYLNTCPTGLEPVTYVITESCETSATARPSTHIPRGFTVTEVECPHCPMSTTVTLTRPIATTTAPPVAIVTPPMMNTTVCHNCTGTPPIVPAVQQGVASMTTLGFSIIGLFTFISGALIVL